MAKIRTIELSELVPVKTPRQPSPRQLLVVKREAEFERALNRLEPGKALAFSPEENDKLPTLRASLARVIARNERAGELHFAIINRVAYVALEPIPGARAPRRKKVDG